MEEHANYFDVLVKLAGPLITLLSVITAVLIGLKSLRTNASVNLRNKKIDVIISCNNKYDDVYKAKIALISKIAEADGAEGKISAIIKHEIEIESYYRRYWGMKSDQLDYWLAGYIDPETMISWFMYTVDTIHNQTTPWEVVDKFRHAGWHLVKAQHLITNARLYALIEEIVQEKYARMSSVEVYASLFHKFERLEFSEESMIDLITRASAKRASMIMFYWNLDAGVRWVVDTVRARDGYNAPFPKPPSKRRKFLNKVALFFQGFRKLYWFTWWTDMFVERY